MKINKIEVEIEGKTVSIERLVRGVGATIFVNDEEFTTVPPLADEIGCFRAAEMVMTLCYGFKHSKRGGKTPNYTNSMCHDLKDVLVKFIA